MHKKTAFYFCLVEIPIIHCTSFKNQSHNASDPSHNASEPTQNSPHFLQAHGGAGLHSDLPLASFYAWARVLRLADGPDEVHMRAIARNQYKKAAKL